MEPLESISLLISFIADPFAVKINRCTSKEQIE